MKAKAVGGIIGAVIVVAAGSQVAKPLLTSSPQHDVVIPQGTPTPGPTYRPVQPSYRAGLPAPPLESDPARPPLPQAPQAGIAPRGPAPGAKPEYSGPATLRLYASGVDLLQPSSSVVTKGDASFSSSPSPAPPSCSPNGMMESDHSSPPLTPQLDLTGGPTAHLVLSAPGRTTFHVALLEGTSNGGCNTLSTGDVSIGNGTSTVDVAMSNPTGPIHDGSMAHLGVTAAGGLGGMVDVRTSYGAPSYIALPVASCNPHICV